jgi:hypothetical protein
VDPDHIGPRDGEHPERVVPAQVLLDQERELLEIAQSSAVLRPHASCIERLAVMRNVAIRVVQRCYQPLCLRRSQFVDARRFDGFEASVGTCQRLIVVDWHRGDGVVSKAL